MKLDRVDIDILYHLHQIQTGEEKSISEIAKEIFNVNDRRELKSKDALVRSRLDKLADYDLVIEVEESSPTSYYLNDHKVIFGDITVDIEAEFQEKEEQYQFPMDRMFFVQKEKGMDVYGYMPDQTNGGDDPRGIYDELDEEDRPDDPQDTLQKKSETIETG